jgi:peptidyl-tRNA hydrolase
MTPVLYDDHDGIDQRRVLHSQDDPLIMYLVAPRRPDAPAGEVLEHAALSAVRCVKTFAGPPEWSTAFTEWERSAFRKVCLGARPAQLERARTPTHASIGDILCFPPRRRSTAEPELARLQAHTGGPLQADDGVAFDGNGPVMVLLVAQDLDLTLGKACAQVARGAHRTSAASTVGGKGMGGRRMPRCRRPRR